MIFTAVKIIDCIQFIGFCMLNALLNSLYSVKSSIGMIRVISNHCRDSSSPFATCGEVMMRGGYRFCLCLSAGVFTKLYEISNSHSPEKNEQEFVGLCAGAY